MKACGSLGLCQRTSNELEMTFKLAKTWGVKLDGKT